MKKTMKYDDHYKNMIRYFIGYLLLKKTISSY